jgi:hypothetical protein
VSDQQHPFTNEVIITDERLLPIIIALQNLHEAWRNKIGNGTLNVEAAIRIGSKLNNEQQQRYFDFVEEGELTDKYEGKLLHGFSLGMPEWSIHYIYRIFKWIEKMKAAMVMLNDVMEEWDDAVQKFEYSYYQDQLPKDDNELEQVLRDFEANFQELYTRAWGEKKAKYNRSYGDSSFSSHSRVDPSGVPFSIMVGLHEEASQKEVVKQGKIILKKLHPDHGGSAYLFDFIKKEYDEYKNTSSER